MKDNQIFALSKNTATLLSTGQIITRVYSVVKELVENSLDAGSTSIEVKLENFGLDVIQVTDNGLGVSTEDAAMMGIQHSTSKIRDSSDLDQLTTYGFRGEAFHALCCVSHVTVATRVKTEAVGRLVTYDSKGRVSNIKDFPAKEGTTVAAKYIFHNFPVRRQQCQSVKRKKEDLTDIERLLMAFAIIRPEIRFVLRHNKNQIWLKNRCSDVAGSLSSVFGFSVAKSLKCVKEINEETKMSIELHVPCLHGATVEDAPCNTKERIFVFVNKRPVRLPKIEKVLKQFYEGKRFHKCLLAAALINVAPSDLDINLEPDKTKIFLKHEAEVIATVKSLLNTLKDPGPALLPLHSVDLQTAARMARSASQAYAVESGRESAPLVKPGLAEPPVKLDLTRFVGARDPPVGGLVTKDIRWLNEENPDLRKQKNPKPCGGSNSDLGIRFVNVRDSIRSERDSDRGRLLREGLTSGYGSELASEEDFLDAFEPLMSRPLSEYGQFEPEIAESLPNSSGRKDVLIRNPCTKESNFLEKQISDALVDAGALRAVTSSALRPPLDSPVAVDGTAPLEQSSRTVDHTARTVFDPFPSRSYPAATPSQSSVGNAFISRDCGTAIAGVELVSRGPSPIRDLLSELGVERSEFQPLPLHSEESEASKTREAVNGGGTPAGLNGKKSRVVQATLDGSLVPEEAGVNRSSRLAWSRWSRRSLLGPEVQPFAVLGQSPEVTNRREGRFNGGNLGGRKSSEKPFSKPKSPFATVNEKIIRRPQTAYQYYCKETKPKILQEQPKADFYRVGRLLNEGWASLPREQRNEFEGLAVEDSTRYIEEREKAIRDRPTASSEISWIECALHSPTPDFASVSLTTESLTYQPTVLECESLPATLEDIVGKLGKVDLERHQDCIIGPLHGIEGWAVLIGKDVGILNPARVSEMRAFRTKLANAQVSSQRTARPIVISKRDSTIEVWKGVESLKTQEQDDRLVVCDQRFHANGLLGEILRDFPDGGDTLLIQGVPTDIPFFSKVDVEEILVQVGHSRGNETPRCVKVRHFIQGEVLREFHATAASLLQRQDVEEILNYFIRELEDDDVCLHDRPLFYPLANITET